MTSVFVTGSRDWPSQYVLDAALKKLKLIPTDGRAASAPQAMGA